MGSCYLFSRTGFSPRGGVAPPKSRHAMSEGWSSNPVYNFFTNLYIIFMTCEKLQKSEPSGINGGGVILSVVETSLLHIIAGVCRGDGSHSIEELYRQADDMGLRHCECDFLVEAFREGGDIHRLWSPRQISSFLRKRAVGRLMDWGVGEGLCDNGMLTKNEMDAYLARVFRSEESDNKERHWAFEQWSKMHENQEKRKAGSRAGNGVNIVIIDPYQRGVGGSPVSVGGKDISGVVDVSD